MYNRDPSALNDFGELKYITLGKQKIEWYDIKEPAVILKKYSDGQPLRAIASEHGRSIDQIRDFVFKIKEGIVTSPTHFAVMDTPIISPDFRYSVDLKETFRDGTPQQRAAVFYRVPGADCYICPTTGRFFSVLPDPDYLAGDSLGLENDTIYSIPNGILSAGAAIKRTFWDQKTEHSLVLFNPQIASNVIPWCRDFTAASIDFLPYAQGFPMIFEDTLYADTSGKQATIKSFYPDVVTRTEFGVDLCIKSRGVKYSYSLAQSVIDFRVNLRSLCGV